MKIIEKIADFVLLSFYDAIEHRKIVRRIREEQYEIAKSLIGIITDDWSGRDTANSCLYRIQELTLDGESRLSSCDYFKILWSEPFARTDFTQRYLARIDVFSAAEILHVDLLLQSVYAKICEDVSKNKFFSVMDYINEEDVVL